jgi:circadian clock protein KaiA
MLLPILLTCPPIVKKYLYDSDPANKQAGLLEHFQNFIDVIFYRDCDLALIATDPIEVQYLQNSKQAKNNQLLQDNHENKYVMACHEQKSQQLFQEMSPEEKQKLLQDIKSDYRKILINYFITDKTLKTTIDKFINALFYANIPVPQIIEIHVELIDEFSKQLKLEGRSDETLLDYRLTLIDILANLCEVYRCSISKMN